MAIERVIHPRPLRERNQRLLGVLLAVAALLAGLSVICILVRN